MTSMNASLTFKELRYVTDVPVYVTKSAANVIAFTASLVVTICLGFYGLGRDVKGNAMEINDEYPVGFISSSKIVKDAYHSSFALSPDDNI